jgi:hypothetical protein
VDPLTLGLIGLGAYLIFGSGSSRSTYRRKNGSWRAYFNRPPSMSHMLHDGDGYYVVLRAHRTVPGHEMRQVARRWTDIYG